MSLITRLTWTLGALAVYLIASQIPLFGILTNNSQEAFYLMRTILASNKNTLMELGISPIITSGMVMQLLTGANILAVDMSKPSDRALYNAATKLLGILITIGSAVAYVLAGNYGAPSQLGTTGCLILVLQLFISGIIVLMLDELLSKGYGLGGGINVFIVTNICEGILWSCFSPMTYSVNGSNQFEGAVISFFHLLITDSSKGRALKQAFFRDNLPNLSQVFATFFVFLVASYIQGYHKKVTVAPGPRGSKPTQHQVKLFYTSNMPIILLSALLSQLYFFSQILYNRYGTNPFVKLLGVWSDEGTGRMRPIWGLSYLISPPQGITSAVQHPIQAIFYILFMWTACAAFARVWLGISNSSADDILKMYRNGAGKPEDFDNLFASEDEYKRVRRNLRNNVETAAALGGICIATLSIGADLLGAIGSGTGILLAVTIIYDLYEKLGKASGISELLQGRNPDVGYVE